ncbi:hypothetical protein [Hyalangium rubrum]|uniref:Lipoprotein n=1 Tax=Hyalangium rubrum TaxID=3103134 RepID=A0ABU5HFA2_9BACT|nr:hypothetical protein [Hyalangium sp. s54d21]MDY7232161.1 hypothetical protein [Hyalangium sp. s54d21]
MNLRLLAGLLCLVATLAGCNDGTPHEPDVPDAPSAKPGDVAFLWAFSGAASGRCADVPDVTKVRISIPGQTLPNGGVQACNSEGVDGFTLRNIAPGLYTYTVEALGSSDEVLYSGTGSFTVDGNTVVSSQLSPVSRPPSPGDVSFRWSFVSPPLRCVSMPDVRSVRIRIPDHVLPNDGLFPCSTSGLDGTTLLDFAPGAYSYTVEALGASGEALYRGTGSFTVDGDTQVNVSLERIPPPPPVPGDVTFLWSFPGSPRTWCADVPDVVGVRITIPGENLPNGGSFPCTNQGVDGIAVHDFAPGHYEYTLEAVNASNSVLYSGKGAFTVNGDTLVKVALISGQSSFAYVSWTLSNGPSTPNPTCAEAGVSSVVVLIDGWLDLRFNCAEGADGNRVTTFPLSPGQHGVELSGLNRTDQLLFSARGTLETRAESPVAVSYTLRRLITIDSQAR